MSEVTNQYGELCLFVGISICFFYDSEWTNVTLGQMLAGEARPLKHATLKQARSNEPFQWLYIRTVNNAHIFTFLFYSYRRCDTK